MREYAVNNYGFVLSPDLMRILASKICEDFTEEEYEEDKYYFHEEVEKKIGCEYISSFDGEAICLQDDGWDDYRNSEYFSDDVIYFIPLTRYPNLFSTAYVSMNEVVSEIHGCVGAYLPDGYNIRENICHIVGTYYG